MSVRVTPQGGRYSLPVGRPLFFDLDPSEAAFTKEGENLVVTPASGAPTVVSGFFSHAAAADQELVLADGTRLNGQDFFKAYSPDLVTAVGPAPAAPSSGGEGSYSDSAGELISGVGRLNAVASAAEEGRNAVEEDTFFPVASAATDMSELADPAGPQPPAPPVPPAPEYRFVVFGSAADSSSWAPGITAGLDTPAPITSVRNGRYGTAELLPDGSIKYTPVLSPSDWPADGSPVKDSVLITLADGSVKAVEVLAVNGTGYNAADRVDLGGERHEGLIEGVYTVTATDHADTFTRRTGAEGLAAGSVLNMQTGNDTLTIQAKGTDKAAGIKNASVSMGEGDDAASVSALGESDASALYEAVMDMGTGNDSLNVSASAGFGLAYGIRGGNLNMGAGNDTLAIAASAGAYSNSRAYGIDKGAAVDLGGGDNLLSISIAGTQFASYGIYSHPQYSVQTGVSAGSGNDTVNISVEGSSSGYGIYCSTVRLGDGDNLLSTAVNARSGYGVYQGEVYAGSGNDSLVITHRHSSPSPYGTYGIYGGTVNLGEGANLVQITGAQSGLSGSVTTGSGNDTVIIESANGSSGISGRSAVNTGAGDDLLRVSIADGNSPEALRTGAVNMGNGNDTVTFSTSGSYSVGGMNDSAYLSLGDGNDSVSLSASSRGIGFLAFGLHNSSKTDLGNGDDTLTMHISVADPHANASGIYAYGAASGSRISGGAGKDVLSLNVSSEAKTAGPEVQAMGVTSAVIDAGSGDDIINITVSAASAGGRATACGVTASHDRSYTSVAGDGNDTVTLLATARGGSALAAGVKNAGLTTDAGDDVLNITARSFGTTAEAYGLQQADARTGSGNDSVTILAESDGTAYGLGEGVNSRNQKSGAVLDLGDGDDTLSVHASGGKAAYGADHSSIIAGAGDDNIRITAETRSGTESYGLSASSLLAGEGDDSVYIQAGKALHASFVDLGAGNDTLEIHGAVTGRSSISTGDGNDLLLLNGAFNAGGFSQLVNAGNGNDTIVFGPNFSMGAGTAVHGGAGTDVLELHGGSLDFSAHSGQFSGLERINLTNGSNSVTLGLNDVLSLADNAEETLRIFGNSDDTVNLSGSGWSMDSAARHSFTDADGVTREYHAAVNGNTTVYVDVQTTLNFIG